MRYQMFGISCLLAVATVGCGDDGGMVMKMPDAKVFMDAAIDAPPACLVPATIPAGSLGNSMMPRNGHFINKTMQGQVFFGLGLYLDQSMKTAITIIVPRPAAGFQTNTAYAFDPNPTSMTPTALAYVEDGLDAQGNAQHTLWASNGSVTFTAIGQTAGATINGSSTTAMFREVDGMTGADIAGGCTTTDMGLSWFLTQDTAVTKPAPTTEVPVWHLQKIVDRLEP